jgi:hypothetical protein
MRQTITGLAAAIAVLAVSAAPAMACGLFESSTCAPVYTPPVYSDCNCGGGWGHERLADPAYQYGAQPYATHQYYYVNQGPTYTGPGDFAPRPTYQEGGVAYPYHMHHYRPGYAHYGYRHYGYEPHHYGYMPHHYGYEPHHSMRYGYYGAPHHYGYHEHVLRRYY